MGRIINYKLYKVDLVEERTKKRFSQFVLFTIIDVCCNSERAVLNRKPAPHQHPRSGAQHRDKIFCNKRKIFIPLLRQISRKLTMCMGSAKSRPHSITLLV